MKKLLITMGGCFLVLYTFAQIPSIKTMEEYKKLVFALEPVKQPVSDKIFYISGWKQDTTIYLRDEITLFKEGKLWRDSLHIKKTDSLFFSKTQTFPDYGILLPAKYGKQKPQKIREYYEQKRGEELRKRFDEAATLGSQEIMEQILNIIAYYYQTPELLTNKKQKEQYQEYFISMRQQYSLFLFECYKTGKCSKKDISKLFWYTTKVYPNSIMAQAVIDYVYHQEKKYLFTGTKTSDIFFPNTAEYFLSLLQIYNITGIDQKTKADVILKAYRNLFELSYVSYEKNHYQKIMKQYLQETYDIHP